MQKVEIRKLKLADLVPAEYNPRSISAEALAGLKASVARYGLVEPIIVNSRNGLRVIGGHQRLKAALDLGVVESECMVVDLPDNDERALNLTLNNPKIQGEFTDGAADILQELQCDPEIPFEELSLDQLLEDLRIDEVPGSARAAVYPTELIIEEAFKHYRANGFPYRNLPVHVCMDEINKLAQTDTETLISTNVAYQVPDTYYRHRFHAAADGMRSPYDSFMDDAQLRRALVKAIEIGGGLPKHGGYFGLMSIVAGTQACSNFRPGFAAYLYRKYCKLGDTVLDTSTGYGGRLVGFIAANLNGKYIGIDPNTLTHAANMKMAEALGFADKIELINMPAEDVGNARLVGRADFSFTSPPYFCKEHYSDEETQSWMRYKTGEEWRDGFLRKMLELQYAALKPGCINIVNIADVKIKNKVYPLAQWTIDCAIEAGFIYVETLEFPMVSRKVHAHGAEDADEEPAIEPVLVFQKPVDPKAPRIHAKHGKKEEVHDGGSDSYDWNRLDK